MRRRKSSGISYPCAMHCRTSVSANVCVVPLPRHMVAGVEQAERRPRATIKPPSKQATFVDTLSRSSSQTLRAPQLENRPAAALAASSGHVDDLSTRFGGSFFGLGRVHRAAVSLADGASGTAFISDARQLSGSRSAIRIRQVRSLPRSEDSKTSRHADQALGFPRRP